MPEQEPRLGAVPMIPVDGDGDVLVDSVNDAVRVNVVASSAGGGGTSMQDDTAFTPDGSSVTPMGAVYQATPDNVDDNDVGAVRMTQARILLVDASGATVPISHAALTELAAAINASSQMDVNLAASGITLAISNAGLTELAAAINASSQMDVNVAANGIGLLTTAAHDAAFGTAGSADSQVRSIQGVASMTPVQVGDNSASLSVDWNGTQPVTGSGNATGALRVELPTNGTGVVGLAAGTNLAGRVVVSVDTDNIYQGTTSRTVGRAIIDAASSGDNTLLAAQGASNKIRVHSLFMVATAAVTVRFESGAGGTALTGQMSLAANGGFVLPWNPLGWFETAANTLLNLELGGAVSVDGSFQYSVVQ